MVKFELGSSQKKKINTSTQKSLDSVKAIDPYSDDFLYEEYKQETNKNATYRRSGKTNETKAYIEWKSRYLSEIQEAVDDVKEFEANGTIPEEYEETEETEEIELPTEYEWCQEETLDDMGFDKKEKKIFIANKESVIKICTSLGIYEKKLLKLARKVKEDFKGLIGFRACLVYIAMNNQIEIKEILGEDAYVKAKAQLNQADYEIEDEGFTELLDGKTEKKKDKKKKDKKKTISATELSEKITQHQYNELSEKYNEMMVFLEFLYDFMGNKMEMKENEEATDEEYETVLAIKEVIEK